MSDEDLIKIIKYYDGMHNFSQFDRAKIQFISFVLNSRGYTVQINDSAIDIKK